MFIAPPVFWTGLLLIALLAGVAAIIAAMSRHKKSATGKLDLIGARAFVETVLKPEGSILVHGELWPARSRTEGIVERGRRVRIVGASGHLLEVEPTE